MTSKEAAVLCRLVREACPQQAVSDGTPDMWAVVLADIRLADAKEATLNLVRSQPFVTPAEIITEVRKIRSARIAARGDLTPPPGLTDAEERDWLRDARRVVADGGTVDDTRTGLTARPVRALLAAFPRRTP